MRLDRPQASSTTAGFLQGSKPVAPVLGRARSQPVCITYWIRREDRLQPQSGNPNVALLPLSQESGNTIMQMMTGGCVASRTANPPARAHRNTSSPSRSHQRTPRLGSRGGRQRIPINNHLDSPVTDVLARQIAHLMRRETEHAGVDLQVRDLLEQFTGMETPIYPSGSARAPSPNDFLTEAPNTQTVSSLRSSS